MMRINIYLCDDDHDEIVYINRTGGCPLCESNKQIEELESERDDLKESNEHLEAVVEKLEEDE